MRELGKALKYSREVLVNEAMSSGVMRWVHYELILFGDPSIAVKDPIGGFPYIRAINATFDDVQGDGDGIPNPGNDWKYRWNWKTKQVGQMHPM